MSRACGATARGVQPYFLRPEAMHIVQPCFFYDFEKTVFNWSRYFFMLVSKFTNNHSANRPN